MNSKRAIQEILDRFNECIYYKVYRDLGLYGKCVIGNRVKDIKELVEIRRMLDDVSI